MWFRRNKEGHQPNTLTRGAEAETQAEFFLIKQGLVTHFKNYRGKQGEIDLIMSQGMTLVFVEVRMRTNEYFTSAAETVDYRKQIKIIKTAQQFLQEKNLVDKVPCRFDVIAIDQRTPDAASIEWIKDAFSV